MRAHNVKKWQDEFYGGKPIWITMNEAQEISHLFESEEAAQVHVEWERKRKRLYRAIPWNVHTLKLAIERWRS